MQAWCWRSTSSYLTLPHQTIEKFIINILFGCIITKINLPEGDGTEVSPSDVCLIDLLTRIKQMYTSTMKPTTSRAAPTPPTMAATLCFLGFLTSFCCNGVSVGTPLFPSNEAAILLFLDTWCLSWNWIGEFEEINLEQNEVHGFQESFGSIKS